MRTAEFDYILPEELIAQTPLEPRDAARLMVLNRADASISHFRFRDLERILQPGDVLVLNETRVIPARMNARKIPGGGKVEILLLQEKDDRTWEALVGGKRLKKGVHLSIGGELKAEVLAELNGPRRLLRFSKPLQPHLQMRGEVPLPPYIHKPLEDPERYQTVYASRPGSVAAPTAGLHFTAGLIQRLLLKGVEFGRVTLHVGLDTFAPVMEANPKEHQIHTEWCRVPAATVQIVNEARRQGGRVIAVGTTSVRALESAAADSRSGEGIGEFEGPTDLFILPGYEFQVVDAMITNFHLPRSTLLMLVSAFARRDQIMAAYRIAMREGYRFYSFGDAMLIW